MEHLLGLLDNVNTNWNDLIRQYPKWGQLEEYYVYELEKDSSLKIYPPESYIFRCFEFFNIEDTKIIILGQDPYHGQNQATGLAFAVNSGIRKPPSLNNILKTIPLYNCDSSLESWAKQGVLLLNTYLTVRECNPSSHRYIWKDFTIWLLQELDKKQIGAINVIWGAHAYDISSKSGIMQNNTSFISSHPSPLSAHQSLKTYPSFLKSNVFENINKHFEKNDMEKIIW